MTEKRRQNPGGGHHRPGAGRAELVTACHRFDPARGGRRGAICPASSVGGRGIIGPAWPVRGDLSSGAGCCCPLLYSYVGRGGGRSPTGAGIIGPARGCPVLYSYVGRGGVRSPTGAGHHRPGAGRRRGVACPASSGGRGIIGAARPVRGDLSSGAGCCCPLLYSYVGRGGGRSPTGAGIIGPARGGGGVWPVQRSAAGGCDLHTGGGAGV